MKAARLVSPGKMECEQAPVPEPKAGEVLVKSELAAICGSDLHVIYYGVSLPPFPQAPGFPGHEGVGEVLESRHPAFKPGQKVLTCPAPPLSHTFAEYQTVGAQFCVGLPAYEGPIAHLLMAQQLGTVIYALRQAHVDVVGRTAMVVGQGSAGMFFAWLLKRAGAAQVIVSDLSEARLAASRAMGASDVAVKAQNDNVKQAVLDHTGGLGADFLVEAVGTRATLLQTVDLVRPEASMLLFGLPDTANPVPWNFHDFFRKKLRALSTYGAQHEADQASFKLALELIAGGKSTEAIPVLERLMVQQPSEEVYSYLGGAYVQEKAWDKAAATYEDGATKFPLSARLNYAAGLAHERRFEPGKALHFYRRAVRLDPMLAYQGAGRYDPEIDALYIPVVHDHRGANSCSGRLYYDEKGMHYMVYLVFSGWGQGNDDSFKADYDQIDSLEVDHKQGQQNIDYSVLTLLTNLSGPRRRIGAGEEARVDLKFFFKKPIAGYRGNSWTKNDIKFFFIEPEMGDRFVKYLESKGVKIAQRTGS